jgi:hypothetical protein
VLNLPEGLASGMYLVTVHTAGHAHTQRIVLQRD